MENLTVEQFEELLENNINGAEVYHYAAQSGEFKNEDSGITTKYGSVWYTVDVGGISITVTAGYQVNYCAPETLVLGGHLAACSDVTIDGDEFKISGSYVEELINRQLLPAFDTSEISERLFVGVDGMPVHESAIDSSYLTIGVDNAPDLVFKGELLVTHRMPEYEPGFYKKISVYQADNPDDKCPVGKPGKTVTVATLVSMWDNTPSLTTYTVQ